MAKSRKPVTPSWARLIDPDAKTSEQLRDASPAATLLVQCGGIRDAVVIAPLQRGLAVLDHLGLPVEDGYSVLADHLRQELIVLVAGGTAPELETTQGVRVLSHGHWLLVPAQGGDGSLAAAWLSRPKTAGPRHRWVDADEQPSLGRVPVAISTTDLRDALTAVDKPVVPT
ncbi:hypothetical protein ACT1U9_32870 (plasmid) [Streptomyces sp. BR1]|uniref:hypothetical protein n=1 Tax=Streptomyces sp. BR1 TaxID=1592323 RepID=UPI00402BE876